MQNEIFTFIADVHLGKLARFMRLCGIDTVFRSDYDDDEIIGISLKEGRIILTRDKLLANNTKATLSFLVRSQIPGEQLKEVFRRYDMTNTFSPFSRCMECNGLLKDVDKKEIAHRLKPGTLNYFNYFRICPDCDHIYWEGSHYEKMKKFIESVLPR